MKTNNMLYFFLADDTSDLTCQMKEVRNILDGIQFRLYNQFRPEYRNIKGLTIIDEANQNLIIKQGKLNK